MKEIVTSDKSVDQAVADLEQAVAHHKFGVLHTYDLKETLRGKGIDLPEECRILEICNPNQAKKVLDEEMEMNVALPCRISVWSENGSTRIGMISPKKMLNALSDSSVLAEVADEVEEAMRAMMAEAR